MSPQVDAIWQQIEQLNSADRLVLHERLQALEDAEWRQEAEVARAEARQRGIDQPMIDSAVEHLRYGP